MRGQASPTPCLARFLGCVPPVPPLQDKERAAVAHTEQQRAGGGGGGRGRGRGGRGGVAASRQDPYERLFPARQVRV